MQKYVEAIGAIKSSLASGLSDKEILAEIWAEIFRLDGHTLYKFRAEAMEDVEIFINKKLKTFSHFQIKKLHGYPDVEVTFYSKLSLSEIIDLMRSIPDGQVMYQTVKPINEFDGVRNYEL